MEGCFWDREACVGDLIFLRTPCGTQCGIIPDRHAQSAMWKVGEAEAKGMLKVLLMHMATGTHGVFQEISGPCYQQHLEDSPHLCWHLFPRGEWPVLSLWLGCFFYSGQR